MKELIEAIVLEAEYAIDELYLASYGVKLISKELWINVKDDPSFIDIQKKIVEGLKHDP